MAIFLAVSVLLVGLGGFLATLPRFRRKLRSFGDYPADFQWPVKDGFFHFHVSPELFRQLAFDSAGVLVTEYPSPIGRQHNPVAIAGLALSLVPYLDEPAMTDVFRKQIDSLLSYGQRTAAGGLLYPFHFDFPPHREKAPWYSAMAQGHAVSAFLWGHRLFREPVYEQAARDSIRPLIDENSPLVKRLENGQWLMEYPDDRFQVMDGSLAAIAGVYDLWKSLPPNDPLKGPVENCLRQALRGLKTNAAAFRCLLGGHYYSDDRTIVSPSYAGANLAWLHYLSAFDAELLSMRKGFVPPNATWFKCIALYWNAFNRRVRKPLHLARPRIR